MAEQSRLIPARYTGHHAALLRQKLSFNIDGTRRTSPILESGDTIMMPEREILGFTLLHDPHMVKDPLDLGAGKRVLPEHAGLNAEHLAALGYEFHGGRTDFEVLAEENIEPSAPSDASQIQETPPAEAPAETARETAEVPPSDPLTVLSHLSSGGN